MVRIQVNLVVLSVVLFLFLLAGCGSSDRAAQDASSGAMPRPVAFSMDSHTQAIPPDKTSHAWTITSIGYRPITIRSVAFNGEQAARLANFDGKQYAPSDRSFPVTLKTGEAITLFQDNPDLSDYRREIHYVILDTDQGHYRHDLGKDTTTKIMP